MDGSRARAYRRKDRLFLLVSSALQPASSGGGSDLLFSRSTTGLLDLHACTAIILNHDVIQINYHPLPLVQLFSPSFFAW